MDYTLNQLKGGLSSVVFRHRQARGWTLEKLAEVSGATKSTLSKIENEKANPCLSTLRQLAEAFELELGDFFEQVGVASGLVAVFEKEFGERQGRARQ